MDSPLIWFVGDEVHVYGIKSSVIPNYPVEDTFLINLKFTNGKIVRITDVFEIVKLPMPMMS